MMEDRVGRRWLFTAGSEWLAQRVRSGRFLIGVFGLVACAPFAYLSLASGSLIVAKSASAAFGFFAGLYIANVFAGSYDVIARQNYGLATGVLNLIGGLA